MIVITLWFAAGLLMLLITLGLWRIVKGPHITDRMLAAQLAGSTGVALVVLLAWFMDNHALLDVALLLGLLAAISGIAFAKLLRPKQVSNINRSQTDHVSD
ncbi:monovalent cation/H+ antiporter complex subunit F [Thiomicrospira sp. ALE5]|uniref:monovalent cation/H+ antiporter complex subunit F n=1 Tax=Thiomicrospira sp. ALE5 TaxID=748650 RepID=UPI0008E8A8DD|nr:monovalent cation/H+ antiporter complex subunit F [Thiomicrospira sp. ALE5]SFR53005.1 multicomponent Na+:H+ antiporter subunit F [Thiomicrospira sp. ALE5]